MSSRMLTPPCLLILLLTIGNGAVALAKGAATSGLGKGAVEAAESPPAGEPDAKPAAAPTESSRDLSPVCLVISLSGSHAALGGRVARAIEQVLGAAGVPVRRLDDRGEPAGVVEAVARLDEESCVALIGGPGDEEARALADAAASRGLPLLVLGAAPDGRTRAGITWARTPRSEPIEVLASRLAGASGIKVAYVLAPATRYGRSAVEAFRASFEAAGGRVAVARVLGPEDTDPRVVCKTFGAQVREARQAGACVPEAVYLPMDADGTRRWLGFLEGEGVVGSPEDARCPRPVVAGTSAWADALQLARNGAALEGARFGDVRVTGDAPGATVLEAEAADAARLLVAALRAAPNRGRRDVIHALETGAAIEGSTGRLKAEHGRVVGRDVTTFTLRAGRPVPDEDPL